MSYPSSHFSITGTEYARVNCPFGFPTAFCNSQKDHSKHVDAVIAFDFMLGVNCSEYYYDDFFVNVMKLKHSRELIKHLLGRSDFENRIAKSLVKTVRRTGDSCYRAGDRRFSYCSHWGVEDCTNPSLLEMVLDRPRLSTTTIRALASSTNGRAPLRETEALGFTMQENFGDFEALMLLVTHRKSANYEKIAAIINDGASDTVRIGTLFATIDQEWDAKALKAAANRFLNPFKKEREVAMLTANALFKLEQDPEKLTATVRALI